MFRNFFLMLLKRAFRPSSLRIKLHTRTHCNFFNLTHLRAKRNVKHFTVQDVLLADDSALVARSAQDLQTLLSTESVFVSMLIFRPIH